MLMEAKSTATFCNYFKYGITSEEGKLVYKMWPKDGKIYFYNYLL
jgi:hypothetical protein